MSERDFDELSDARLGAALRAFGDGAVRSYDPRQVAQAAVAAGAKVPWRSRLWPIALSEGGRRIVWAAALLLVALAVVAGMLLAGAIFQRPPIAPPVLGAGCDVLDPLAARAGAVDGGGWPAAPAPGPRSDARRGLLAGWVNYAPPGSQTLDYDLVLIDPATGAETRLTHFDKSFSSQQGRIEWSPDGSALAVWFDDHRQCANLYVITADGSRLIRPVRNTRVESNDAFAWAPDGSALAVIHVGPMAASSSPPATGVVAPTNTETSLRLVPRDGSPVLDLGNPCMGCQPVNTPMWSPDGSQIATVFFREPGGLNTTATGVGIAVTAPDRVGWTTLHEEPASDSGYLSPIGWLDGRRILGQRPAGGDSSGALVTLSSQGNGDLARTGLVLPATDQITLSPDGRAVIDVAGTYSADGTPLDQAVKVVDLATGASHTVWTSGIGIVVNVVWSPDSRALALTASAYPGADMTRVGLWIVNADTTGLRRVRADPIDVVWQPVWP